MLITCGSPSFTSKVLKIHVSGYPIEWITHQDAARLITNNDIEYAYDDYAEETVRLRGGRSSLTGMTSFLDIPPILAVNASQGTSKVLSFADYAINDELIFRRDGLRCAYCGISVKMLRLDKLSLQERRRARYEVATKDHIFPQSRGGKNTWTNLITACGSCNHDKADRTPEEAGMPLRWRPFKPNRHEYMCLTNKQLLQTQLRFLSRHFKVRNREDAQDNSLAAIREIQINSF